ncbi:MAG TPA: serine/threonine-protein kinase [Rubrobacteraceae bacterium]|nr:serine/threonine-protein kinase [Rubrobacteraceae bacterium]
MRRVGERFVLEREIGAGGMSKVFLGRDEVLDRNVAVKILKPGYEESDIGARFRREGRTAARLSHPNIVQVYDAGEDDLEGRSISYIVMEYVSGGDLKDLIDQKGPLPETDLASIGADVASGLAHAHERGIIHRDVKPQNVLIDEYGRPKLADFGIARALDQATTYSTRTGSYLGTATYSSPEQLRGEEITPRSDVYSLGATLYHAATGEPPFAGAPIEVASQQLSRSPAPPRERGAHIGETFEAVILACLAKSPADRPEAAGLHTRLLQRGAASAASATTSAGRSIGAVGFAGAARIAKSAKEAGATRFGAVARRMGGRFRRWERSEGSGIPTRTMVVPTRTFRSGPNRAALLVAGAVALLLLFFAVWGVSAMLGTAERADTSGQTAAKKQSAAKDPAAPDDGSEDAASQTSAPDQRDSAPGKVARDQKEANPPKAAGPLPPVDGATDAVYNMYVSAGANDDYARSWSYLSERYKRDVGSLEEWRKRYESVSYVFFPSSPTAKVVGDKAEVEFEVQETRDGGTKTVSGKWVCVNEGGEWRLDRLAKSG